MTLIFQWLRAFALTQIIEIPIYRRAFDCGFWEAFGASAITHPVVFAFSVSGVWHVGWSWRAVACETFAWWVEAGYFALRGRRRVILWSLVANAASFSFGIVCWWLFGSL